MNAKKIFFALALGFISFPALADNQMLLHRFFAYPDASLKTYEVINAPSTLPLDSIVPKTGVGSIISGPSRASTFVINVTYDSSVNSAPAGFKTAVADVVTFLEANLANTSATVNIHVGYGEVNGMSLCGSCLGE